MRGKGVHRLHTEGESLLGGARGKGMGFTSGVEGPMWERTGGA